MEDIEVHLGVLYNSFMEVNDHNNLDTGHCRCRDVLLSPVLNEPQVSPSISAGGAGECQEIGLVAIMFFFELLFSYVSSQFPSMFFPY